MLAPGIGVMPRAFYFPNRNVQLWTLLTFDDQAFANRSNNYLEGVGRLNAGVSFKQAHAELSAIAERLVRDFPDTNAETGVSFFRMRDNMSPRFQMMLLTLTGASLCLLLLTCANLTNLLLARAAAHEREMAVRAALGARRARLVASWSPRASSSRRLEVPSASSSPRRLCRCSRRSFPPTLPVATQPGGP